MNSERKVEAQPRMLGLGLSRSPLVDPTLALVALREETSVPLAAQWWGKLEQGSPTLKARVKLQTSLETIKHRSVP